MLNDKDWLLMTYYCPTHGKQDRCKPIQLSKSDLLKVRDKFSKNRNFKSSK